MKSIVIITCFIYSALAEPTLWVKAKEFCPPANFTAKKIVTQEVITTKKGQIVEQSSVTLHEENSGKTISYKVATATKNGKVVTKKSELKKLQESINMIKPEDLYGEETQILQNNISKIATKAPVFKKGKQTIPHLYTQKTKDGIWRGTLYIEKKSGYPSSFEAEFENVPFKESGANVTKLSMEGIWTFADSTTAVLSSVTYTSHISIKEGILPVFHGITKNTLKFSHYQSTTNKEQ